MPLAPAYPILTERVLLRPLDAADADALLAYRSRPDVCRYVPFEPMDSDTIAQMLAGPWATHAIDAEGDALMLGVVRRDSAQLVGDVVLMFRSAEHQGGEIGWVLHPDHRGQGFATDAARAMLRLAFDGLGLHRVIARIDARNGPSPRLAERIGMRREAHLVENEFFKGAWADEHDFAMLDREFQSS